MATFGDNETDEYDNDIFEIKSNRYITKIFIEVLKMVGLRGYNTLPYQWILDNEGINDLLLKRGDVDKVNYFTDEKLGGDLYNYYKSIFRLPNKYSPSLREQYTTVFSKGNDIIIVFFLESEANSSGVENMRRAISVMREICKIRYGNVNYCDDSSGYSMKAVFITQKKLTPDGKKMISSMPHIEHFLDNTFLAGIAQNIFCSKYEILTEEKKKVFETQLDLHLSKIPSVTTEKDISVRFIGVNSGDILKYNRTSFFEEDISQTSVTYRLVK